MFHDPAYIAEKFWGTFRFSYGVRQDEKLSDDEDIRDAVKQKIPGHVGYEIRGLRDRDLSSLYRRAAKKWTPPSQRKSQPDAFDNALQKAYFDGREHKPQPRLGPSPDQPVPVQNVPKAKEYNPEVRIDRM